MTTDRKYVRALVSSIASLFCRRRCLEARIGAIGFRSSRLVPSFFSARRVSTRERERYYERKWLPPILSLFLSLSLTDALPKRRPNGFDD